MAPVAKLSDEEKSEDHSCCRLFGAVLTPAPSSEGDPGHVNTHKINIGVHLVLDRLVRLSANFYKRCPSVLKRHILGQKTRSSGFLPVNACLLLLCWRSRTNASI